MKVLALWCVLIVLVNCAHVSQVATVFPDDARELARLEAQGSPETNLELVQALERAQLFTLAFIYASWSAKSSSPQRTTAQEALVRLQARRQDDFFIPSALERLLRDDRLSVSGAAAERVTWLVARIAYRRGELRQVVALCERIPSTSPDHARAQYLMALALADDRLDGGAGFDRALSVLGRLAEGVDERQEAAEAVHAQSLLALGRLSFARQSWSASIAWYERAAKLPKVRASALFEQSLAHLRAGDFRRAAELLRTPEVRGSGNPEVALTEAMAAHFAQDLTSAEAALARFAADPQRVDWSKTEPGHALEACRTGRQVSPTELKVARENPILVKLLASLESAENERRVVSQVESWQRGPTGAAFESLLQPITNDLRLVADRYCLNEFKRQQAALGTVRQQAELMSIEVALAGRDLETAIARAEVVEARMSTAGAPSTDLLFRLMALKQARAEALKGAEAEAAHAEILTLFQRIAEQDPGFARLDEARGLVEQP